MAGRLGVLRKLVGVEGSWPAAVQCEDARAESLRSSSSSHCWVLCRADALGPGEVRGRRTLLSHPRDAGLGEGLVAVVVAMLVLLSMVVVVVVVVVVGERWGCWFDVALVSPVAVPGA